MAAQPMLQNWKKTQENDGPTYMHALFLIPHNFLDTAQLHFVIKLYEVRHPKTPQECAVRTHSASSRLHSDSSCPGNPVLKILNSDLTYDAFCVSPQSRNRISD